MSPEPDRERAESARARGRATGRVHYKVKRGANQSGKRAIAHLCIARRLRMDAWFTCASLLSLHYARAPVQLTFMAKNMYSRESSRGNVMT